MRDRTPTKALENGALRYGVYAEDGSFQRYEYLALEDDPADPGTELRKSTLLQDSTEVSLFGSAADRTVDEAFAGIAGQLKLIKSDVAAITLTVQDANGKPIPEVLVRGILSENGQAVYTNANGVVTGYIGEGAQDIKVNGYADLEDYSETVTAVKGETINKTIKLTTRNFLKITASKSVAFSGNVKTVDVTAVGGGGGGYNAYGAWFPGGGGGYCVVKENADFVPNQIYKAIVGAGGYGSYTNNRNRYPTNGGASSFLGISAEGGHAGMTSDGIDGAGNGRGGYVRGVNGPYIEPVAGSVPGYSSFTETVLYGGGGAGGYRHTDKDDSDEYYNRTKTTYGGDTGFWNDNNGTYNGKAGFGGGGGGSWAIDGTTGPAGNGGSGCIAIRMHLKSAA